MPLDSPVYEEKMSKGNGLTAKVTDRFDTWLEWTWSEFDRGVKTLVNSEHEVQGQAMHVVPSVFLMFPTNYVLFYLRRQLLCGAGEELEMFRIAANERYEHYGVRVVDAVFYADKTLEEILLVFSTVTFSPVSICDVSLFEAQMTFEKA